jgi:hypothetical protein
MLGIGALPTWTKGELDAESFAAPENAAGLVSAFGAVMFPPPSIVLAPSVEDCAVADADDVPMTNNGTSAERDAVPCDDPDAVPESWYIPGYAMRERSAKATTAPKKINFSKCSGMRRRV